MNREVDVKGQALHVVLLGRSFVEASHPLLVDAHATAHAIVPAHTHAFFKENPYSR
jgi:hypothetical protein